MTSASKIPSSKIAANKTASNKTDSNETANKADSSVAASNGSGQPPSSGEPPHEKDVGADCGPMSQQDVCDAHGREMHPQKLVQLVGCHEADAEAARVARFGK